MRRYSHSKINTYTTCPQRFKFTYIDDIKSEIEVLGIETFMGDVVHHCMERLYSPFVVSDKPVSVASQSFMIEEPPKPIETLEEWLKIFDDKWNADQAAYKKMNATIKVGKNASFKKFYDRGQKCLRSYWNKYAPFNDEQTLGVEMEIEIDLNNDGKYILVGLLDRLSRTGIATYNIIDYKTYGRLPAIKKIYEMSKQLEIYEFAIRNKYKDARRINLVWYILSHDEEIRITKNLDDPIDLKYLTNLKNDVIKQIDEMKDAEEKMNFPTIVGKHCDWCKYKPICPAWINKN